MPHSRRQFLATSLALAAAPTLALGQNAPVSGALPGPVERRVSAFPTHRWQDHFETLKNGAILCDTNSRALFYWSEDESVTRIYPTSIPLTDELTRRGRTEVTLKRPAPDWRPTPNMLERDPELPTYIGPGPQNPLGTRALNLSWQYYRIHGTNDIRKIGRRSSSGCIGLFNQHIEELYELAQVGTQVILL